MDRIIVDVQTGIQTTVPLTPEEIVELQALQAELAAQENQPPTLEQLQAQLAALQAQIQALANNA